MSNSHRRATGMVGTAIGALLAAPLLSLLSSPLASADTGEDVTTLGPYDIGGYDDTLSYDTSYAVDNYLTGTYDGSAFDLDTFFGAPGSDTYDVLLTDPGVFQLGVDDVDGTLTYVDNFLGIDFIPTDPGFGLL